MRIVISSAVLFFTMVARLGATNDYVKLVDERAALGETAADYAESPQAEIASVRARARVTLTASATASPAPSFQWRKNGIALPGATNPTLVLGAVTLADAGRYTVLASNIAGAALSNAVALVVNPVGGETTAPVITLQPVSQTADVLAHVTFVAAATGGDTTTYQWQKNGVSIAGATRSTLALASVTSNEVARYTVVATNSAGSVVSNAAMLTVLNPNLAPTVSVQPAHAIATALTSVTLTAFVSGAPATTLQWRKNAVAIPGATRDTLTLEALTTSDAATYTVFTANSAGSAVSNGATLLVHDPRMINPAGIAIPKVKTTLAHRLAAVDPNPVTLDFAVNGTGPQNVLIRAIGPGLGVFGVTGVLDDPVLAVYQGTTLRVQNDNWGGSSGLRAAINQVGAFPIADYASKDAAVLVTLAPGNYHAVVSGANGAIGIVLIDVYEVQSNVHSSSMSDEAPLEP